MDTLDMSAQHVLRERQSQINGSSNSQRLWPQGLTLRLIPIDMAVPQAQARKAPTSRQGGGSSPAAWSSLVQTFSLC